MRYLRVSIIIVSLLFFSIHCFSQTSAKDPIDRSYEDCLGKDTSSANIGKCAYLAYGKWEKELKKYNERLLKSLKKDKDKTAYVQSQKAWLAWRDEEFISYDNMFNRPGVKWTRLRADSRMTVVKERVRQLKEYYDHINKK